MNQNDGLLSAYVLDGNGGGRQIGWPEIKDWRAEDGIIWIHLDYRKEQARRWIFEESRIDPVAGETLLAEETHPRILRIRDSLLIILRGVNFNEPTDPTDEPTDPTDMVSIRMWFERNRIITVRHRFIWSVDDVRTDLLNRKGPKEPGDFFVKISDRLIVRAGPVISELRERTAQLERDVLEELKPDLHIDLVDVRKKLISLHRHIAPQKEVMSQFRCQETNWLDDLHRDRLREISDVMIRLVDDVNSLRERAALIQEEFNNRLSGQMNKTVYRLTVVAAVFLPLSFLTSLFGMDVGGIPGADNPLAFVVIVVVFVFLALMEVWLLRLLKWN